TGENLSSLDFGVERAAAATTVLVAVNDKVAGAIALADLMKESAPQAVNSLREEGMRIVLLTGDRPSSAKMIADKLGITEVQGEVLPEGKGE
ncbi:HAD family hydrolase, partial [Klebsiella pneumoniae]|uniref:HAD family hydrolase n=1 Tax=Klebsiella pneumoniae TaxID=573 RepID=UPI003013BBE0